MNLTVPAKSAIIENVFFQKRRKEVKKMKPNLLLRAMMASLLTLGITTNIIYYTQINKNEKLVLMDKLYSPSIYKEKLVDEELVEDNIPNPLVEEPTIERNEVYDGMTIEELTVKLDKTLSSNLSGMGYAYAKYSIELGVDPYLAVAISMHETGCTWSCSYLARECNNVGGQKGSGCGEYKAYNTLEEGIYGFILNIKNNYVDYGLLTADAMNPKYAEDPMWSSKVNKYIEKIKNN